MSVIYRQCFERFILQTKAKISKSAVNIVGKNCIQRRSKSSCSDNSAPPPGPCPLTHHDPCTPTPPCPPPSSSLPACTPFCVPTPPPSPFSCCYYPCPCPTPCPLPCPPECPTPGCPPVSIPCPNTCIPGCVPSCYPYPVCNPCPAPCPPPCPKPCFPPCPEPCIPPCSPCQEPCPPPCSEPLPCSPCSGPCSPPCFSPCPPCCPPPTCIVCNTSCGPGSCPCPNLPTCSPCCPPLCCPVSSPPCAHPCPIDPNPPPSGFMKFLIIGTKLAVLFGAILWTHNEGVWSNTYTTDKTYRRWIGRIFGIPKELPCSCDDVERLPTHDDINNKISAKINTGVDSTMKKIDPWVRKANLPGCKSKDPKDKGKNDEEQKSRTSPLPKKENSDPGCLTCNAN